MNGTSPTGDRTKQASTLALLVLVLLLAKCQIANGQANETLNLSLIPVASGFVRPVGIVGGPEGRLFVIEQTGIIEIVEADGTVLPAPFLDISDRVDASGNSEGLLGMAFHPDYSTNGYFYLNYINTTGGVRRSRLSRFGVTANPNIADPNSEEILMTIEQPFANHNAGHILFGPDGYLYIPMGDGGSGGDPGNRAQNGALLLGKVSRIDVDAGPGNPPDCAGNGAGNYTVPHSNPFVDGPGNICDEIWLSGVRNPWRSSFDRVTGNFFMGDVGQRDWEEIDFQPAASDGGENYGWRCYEGNHLFDDSGCGPADSFTFPIFEYNHIDNGCSVTGGYVYRGNRFPNMVGRYLFTDFCSGNFWDLKPDGAGGWTSTRHTNLQASGYVAFGEHADGELYVVNAKHGTVYHLQDDIVGLAQCLLEVDKVIVSHHWQTVQLRQTFFDPVIVAKSLSLNRKQPATIRIRNVMPMSFQIRVQEWNYLDGKHRAEEVSWLAVDRGHCRLSSGGELEAGFVDTRVSGKRAFIDVSFRMPFRTTPVLITSVETFNGSDTVVTRNRRVSGTGFQIGMQEQEEDPRQPGQPNPMAHRTETLAFVAVEPGTGTLPGSINFEAATTADRVTDDFFLIDFMTPFGAPPCFIADLQTAAGWNPANLRWRNKTGFSVEVQVDEEKSFDNETRHATEVVGYLAFGCP